MLASRTGSRILEGLVVCGSSSIFVFLSLIIGTSALLLVEQRSLYVNVTENPGELCNRQCVAGVARACYFEFILEYYQAMGVACGKCGEGVEADCDHPQCIVGDGFEKGVMSINRQIPGPALHVCKNDRVIVDVTNHAAGSAAAIHWHGLHMVDTPWMDGVPFVTQCPIAFANTFRYEFTATEAGTQFYHSHSGHHKVSGQYGAFIIREPTDATTNSNSYDYDLPEHYILIADWMHTYPEQYFPGLPGSTGIFPDSVLINGRGTHINSKTDQRTTVPPTRYYVTSGKRYRFRMINSISHACPFQLQIENHSLTIIASDSYNIKPKRTFDTIVTNSGERYDFILDANHTDGDYWMRIRGLGVCQENPTEAFALIRYVSKETDAMQHRVLPDMPQYSDVYPEGNTLNHPNATCYGDAHNHCITELEATEHDDDLMNANVDHKFILGFNNYVVPNEEIYKPGTYNAFANLQSNLTVVGGINSLSLIFPSSPALTQLDDVDASQFCDEFNRPDYCKGNKLCHCVHRIQVVRNAVVEVIIVDEIPSVSWINHPFHLHGYVFRVTNMGQHPKGIPMTVEMAREMDRSRTLPRSTSNTSPPLKDTISIPSRGFATLRFRADNPGFWLMHCHYEWHSSIGMGLVLQVGKKSQMKKAPASFPKCSNYVPQVKRVR